MRIEVVKHHLSFVRPLRTARGKVTRREVHLLILTDADGVQGFGEAAPLPGFGGGDPRLVAQQLTAWTTQGTTLARWWPAGQLPEGLPPFADGAEAAACHALDEALCDLAAKRAGQQLWRWLNPDATGAVATYQLARDESHAATLFAGGRACVKLKVAHRPLLADIEALRTLSNGMTPTQRLRLDANGGWTVAEALEFVRLGTVLPVDVLEQPVAADDWAGLQQVRDATPATWTVSVDEGVPRLLREGFATLLPDALLDAVDQPAALPRWGVVLKPMFLGGIRPVWRFANAALRRAIRVTVTTSLDGIVGRAGAWNLATALGQSSERHGLRTASLLAEDLPTMVWNEPGDTQDTIRLPRDAGLGVQQR